MSTRDFCSADPCPPKSLKPPIWRSRTLFDDALSGARIRGIELIDGEADAMYLVGVGSLPAVGVVGGVALPLLYRVIEVLLGVADFSAEGRRWVRIDEIKRC